MGRRARIRKGHRARPVTRVGGDPPSAYSHLLRRASIQPVSLDASRPEPDADTDAAPPRPMSRCERFISRWTLIPPSRSAASAPPDARNQPRVSRPRRAAVASSPPMRVRGSPSTAALAASSHRLVGIAREPVRADGVDEERDARGETDGARGQRGTVDRHGSQPRTSSPREGRILSLPCATM